MLAVSYCSTKTVLNCSGINEIFKVVFLFLRVCYSWERGGIWGEICCLASVLIACHFYRLDTFKQTWTFFLICHHLARLFEVGGIYRNMSEAKLITRDDFVLHWPWNYFRLVGHLSLPLYILGAAWQRAAGWQKLVAFRRGQNWPQARICYFREECVVLAHNCNF